MTSTREVQARDMLLPMTQILGQHHINSSRWHAFARRAIDVALGDEVAVWHELVCDLDDDGLPIAAHLQIFTSHALVELDIEGIARGGAPSIRSRRLPLRDLQQVTFTVSADFGRTAVDLVLRGGERRHVPRDAANSLDNEAGDGLVGTLRDACA